MNRKIFILILIILVLVSFNIPDLAAQCPMCRIAAESNLQHGGTAGKGLNKGILYLLALPYLLVGGIGVLWYRNRKNNINTHQED